MKLKFKNVTKAVAKPAFAMLTGGASLAAKNISVKGLLAAEKKVLPAQLAVVGAAAGGGIIASYLKGPAGKELATKGLTALLAAKKKNPDSNAFQNTLFNQETENSALMDPGPGAAPDPSAAADTVAAGKADGGGSLAPLAIPAGIAALFFLL